MMDWSLIIFAYNEGPTLEHVIRQCHQFLNQHAHPHSEIILIDDGSTDNTQEITVKLSKEIKALRIIRHPVNQGIGAALRSGYHAATHTYICAVPGDGQFDVGELKQVPPFEKDSFYSFYRVEKSGYSWMRNLLSLTNHFMNAQFLKVKIRDVNWIKVYRIDQLNMMNLSLSSSLIETEISYKLIKSGTHVVQLPSIYLPRVAGVSKGGSTQTMIQALREVASLYLKKS